MRRGQRRRKKAQVAYAMDTVRRLIAEKGVIRAREMVRLGLTASDYRVLRFLRYAERRGPGLYSSGTAPEIRPFVLGAARVDHGVVCLLSALFVHQLAACPPDKLWLAIPHKARAPRPLVTPLELVRESPDIHASGWEPIKVDGVELKVTTLVRTVVDLFKFRHRLPDPTVGATLARELISEGVLTETALLEEAAKCRSHGRVELGLCAPPTAQTG